MIIDDHAAVPVENLPARSDDRDRFDTVGFSPFAVDIGIADLEIPEARDQKQENADGSVLEKGDLFTCEFGVVAEDRLVWNALLQLGFNGYDAHNR